MLNRSLLRRSGGRAIYHTELQHVRNCPLLLLIVCASITVDLRFRDEDQQPLQLETLGSFLNNTMNDPKKTDMKLKSTRNNDM